MPLHPTEITLDRDTFDLSILDPYALASNASDRLAPALRIPMGSLITVEHRTAYHLHILTTRLRILVQLQQATPRRTSARSPRLSLTGQSSLLALSPAYSSSSSSISQS